MPAPDTAKQKSKSQAWVSDWERRHKALRAKQKARWEDENRNRRNEEKTQWHRDHPEYHRSYYEANKARIMEKNRRWREANKTRISALGRLRTLRLKEEREKLSEGEIEQMIELVTKYPKGKAGAC